MTEITENFSVEIVDAGAGLTLRCAGELDFAAANDFKEALDAAFERQPKELSLDWSGLTFMDSTGIRLLLHTLLRCRDRSVDLSWDLSPAARRTLDLVGIHDALLRDYSSDERG